MFARAARALFGGLVAAMPRGPRMRRKKSLRALRAWMADSSNALHGGIRRRVQKNNKSIKRRARAAINAAARRNNRRN